MNNNRNLKTCPCCGSIAKIHYVSNEWIEYVQCKKCGLRTKDCVNAPDYYEDCIDLWNSRHEQNNPQ